MFFKVILVDEEEAPHHSKNEIESENTDFYLMFSQRSLMRNRRLFCVYEGDLIIL